MSLHLVVVVSAHGFGHIGQTAPVVRALQQRVGGLRVTVRSAAPQSKVLERFGAGVEHQAATLDIGMVQKSALEIAVEDTAQAYRALHEDWPEKVKREAKALEALGADMVLSNIPYLPLAAAELARIPAVALGSLHWAEIYRHYYSGKRAEAASVLDDMLAAYNAAQVFLQPAPRMPMAGLANSLEIGPVAQLGTARRDAIHGALGIPAGTRLVMISLGGMDYRLPVEDWAACDDVHFIVPDAWNVRCPGVTPLADIDLPFADVFASCDALIAKPSYASFVEAACLGIPVLHVERPNWPEAPFLVRWLEQHNRSAKLARNDLDGSVVRQLLGDLWSRPAPEPVAPGGVDEAADHVAGMLS